MEFVVAAQNELIIDFSQFFRQRNFRRRFSANDVGKFDRNFLFFFIDFRRFFLLLRIDGGARALRLPGVVLAAFHLRPFDAGEMPKRSTVFVRFVHHFADQTELRGEQTNSNRNVQIDRRTGRDRRRIPTDRLVHRNSNFLQRGENGEREIRRKLRDRRGRTC